MTVKEQQDLKGNAKNALQKAAIVKFNAIEERIMTLRGEKILLDSDVAELYGVQTKRINEAVANNPERFPSGYVFELQNAEKQDVVENFDHLKNLKFLPLLPKAFTESGDIISDILGDDMQVSTAETKYEINFALLKITHTVTKTSKT
jgi:hypothetical protein